MSVRYVVIGAGGHAGVLADALLRAGHKVLGFTDLDPALHGRELCSRPVLGGDEALEPHRGGDVRLVNGIGGIGREGDTLRRRVQEGLEARGWRFAGVCHPSAIVSAHATLADDAQVLAGAIVQPGARVGRGAIINTAAVVEHDCVVGNWTHVAPRALLCGDVRTGTHCHVGAGAVVRQSVVLGDEVIVGAGAVVVADRTLPGTLTGVPARCREAAR